MSFSLKVASDFSSYGWAKTLIMRSGSSAWCQSDRCFQGSDKYFSKPMKWLFWVRGSPECECTPMETIIRGFSWRYCFVSRSVCECGSGLQAFIFPHTWRYKGLPQRQNKSSADNFRHKGGLPVPACRLRITRKKPFG